MPHRPLILTLLLGLTLAGCGVRGQLERPSDVRAAQAAEDNGAEQAVDQPEEDRPFILDGLLL